MRAEYNHLYSLRNSEGYTVLLALWALQHEKIVNAMRKSGKSGKESAWRYYAGQLEGFEVAITQVERAMKDMEEKGEESLANKEAEQQVEDLLKKIKGEPT
jgi:repressor of nif and glnA expression